MSREALKELHGWGMDEMLSVTPPGGKIAEGSRLVPASMGKAPGSLLPDGTWTASRQWAVPKSVPWGEVERWMEQGANVGVRAAKFPAVDIDSMDPALSAWAERLTRLYLGPAPKRVGKAPKALLPYRSSERMTKRIASIKCPDGLLAKVEFLATGQQYVVYGTHPSGSPYTWHFPVDDEPGLTEINRAAVEDFFKALRHELPDGYEWVGETGAGSAEDLKPEELERLKAGRVEDVRALVEALPNRAGTREEWLKVGYAIKAACGAENDEEGFEIWWEWSQRWEGGSNDHATARREWKSLKPSRIGWDWLEAYARDHEEPRDASELFEADQDKPDAGMRLAAIVGAEAVFMSEVKTLAAEEIIPRRAVLLEAEKAVEPLSLPIRMLANALMKERVYYPLDNPERMRRLLMAHEGVMKLAERTKEGPLILEALKLLLAKNLDNETEPNGEFAFPGEQKEPEWLVQGMIPATGIAALIGESTKGKSHVAVLLAKRVAAKPQPNPFEELGEMGQTFGGREVKHGNVIYFAGEDANGILNRFTKYPDTENLIVAKFVPDFASGTKAFDAVLKGASALPPEVPVRLIVVDMLAHAMRNGDENKVQDVKPVIQSAIALAKTWKCLVLFIHHTKKPSENARKNARDLNQARGSNYIVGSMDWVGTVDRPDPERREQITLLESKNKAAAEAQDPFYFYLTEEGELREGKVEARDTETVEQTLAKVIAIIKEYQQADDGLLFSQIKRFYKMTVKEGTPEGTIDSRLAAATTVGRRTGRLLKEEKKTSPYRLPLDKQ